jgi:hypothetical protein
MTSDTTAAAQIVIDRMISLSFEEGDEAAAVPPSFSGVGRIDEHRNAGHAGDEVTQKF